MKQLNVPILIITSSLVAGILVYPVLDLSPFIIKWILITVFAFLFAVHLISNKRRSFRILFTVLTSVMFVLCGYFTRQRDNPLQNTRHYSYHTNDRDQTLLFSITQQLKPTRYQDKYVITLHKLDAVPSQGLLLLNIQKDSLKKTLSVGDWFYTRSVIQEVPRPRGPYQFDYGDYLKKQHIYGQLSIASSDVYASQKTTENFYVWSSRFRESVTTALDSSAFKPKQLAIIKALVLGQKQGLDKELSEQYAAAGMMHILAVSGLHVGIILLLLRFMFKPLNARKQRWLKSTLIIGLIWAFAFVTGLSPSVLRAATMFSFLELGDALGGKRKSQDAVIASAFILLLFNPMLIYQVGFQLSYLAVMAILYVQPWLFRFYEPRNYIEHKAWGVTTVTVAAQIGVVPLSLFYFHQFPGLFFISNIIILPFLTIILGIGILVCLLAWLGVLPELLTLGFGSIIDGMNWLIGWVAHQESFIVKQISISLSMMIAVYVCIFLLISMLKKYTFQKCIYLGIALLGIVAIYGFEKSNPESSHFAIVYKSRFSTIFEFGNGKLNVHTTDTAFDPESNYELTAYKNQLDVDTIEIRQMSSYFRFKQKEILVIDSLSVYDVDRKPDVIVLTQSPDINLKRLIAAHPSVIIVADGSNYRSAVVRWKATCEEQKIPFHNTYEKGAFVIK